MDSSRVYRPARRRRRVPLRSVVAAAVICGAGCGVAAQFGHSPAPVVSVHLAAHRADAGAPAPSRAGRAAPPPAISKLPRVHVLRSLYTVHRLVRVHRLFYVRRPWILRRLFWRSW